MQWWPPLLTPQSWSLTLTGSWTTGGRGGNWKVLPRSHLSILRGLGGLRDCSLPAAGKTTPHYDEKRSHLLSSPWLVMEDRDTPALSSTDSGPALSPTCPLQTKTDFNKMKTTGNNNILLLVVFGLREREREIWKRVCKYCTLYCCASR